MSAVAPPLASRPCVACPTSWGRDCTWHPPPPVPVAVCTACPLTGCSNGFCAISPDPCRLFGMRDRVVLSQSPKFEQPLIRLYSRFTEDRWSSAHADRWFPFLFARYQQEIV